MSEEKGECPFKVYEVENDVKIIPRCFWGATKEGGSSPCSEIAHNVYLTREAIYAMLFWGMFKVKGEKKYEKQYLKLLEEIKEAYIGGKVEGFKFDVLKGQPKHPRSGEEIPNMAIINTIGKTLQDDGFFSGKNKYLLSEALHNFYAFVTFINRELEGEFQATIVSKDEEEFKQIMRKAIKNSHYYVPGFEIPDYPEEVIDEVAKSAMQVGEIVDNQYSRAMADYFGTSGSPESN